MARRFLFLHLLFISLSGVRTHGTAGAAGGGVSTQTNKPEHPFCTRRPYAQQPKMEIFEMDIRTGFTNGYRSNQTVIVEIRAKFPEVWRVQQVFIQVPDDDPYVHRNRGNDYRYHKSVGHWAWNMKPHNSLVGGTKPVDCGGISNYGPFGMLSSMGAHAAKELSAHQDPNSPAKGWTTIEAKWVPPSNWENIIYRTKITIQAFVTFERTPPSAAPAASHISFTSGYTPAATQARWIKKEATIYNLDYIDIHNYILQVYRPWYQKIYGTSQLVDPNMET